MLTRNAGLRGASSGGLDEMDEAEDEAEETVVMRVGCDLEPAEELEARKEVHDAAKRERDFWARQLLVEANRLPQQVRQILMTRNREK